MVALFGQESIKNTPKMIRKGPILEEQFLISSLGQANFDEKRARNAHKPSISAIKYLLTTLHSSFLFLIVSKNDPSEARKALRGFSANAMIE